MAVQSTLFNVDGTTRTFPTSKHIPTKQHAAVRFKNVIDGLWVYLEPTHWNLINNSIIFIDAPDPLIYSQIEIRVADNYDELATALSDISTLAQYTSDIAQIVDNLPAIIAAANGIYLTNGLLPTASCGDLSVDTLTGGIYEWQCPANAWVLIAQSGSTPAAVTPLGVNIVTGLPTIGANGEVIFNNADGYFYGYINGTWTQMIATPTGAVGIEVFTTDPVTGNYEGRVIFNTTTNKMMKFTSGAYIEVIQPTGAAASVADGSITTAKFAAGLSMPEIVDVLPIVGNFVGRLVFLTTDSQLYRYTATGFTTAVPTTALTGTITSTQIGANQVTTGALAVGAITADTIAANAITAGKIATNAITAGTIQAGAIGATEIATGAITAGKIAAGAVTASTIAALSIDATKIIAGSIGADQIAANSITAGKIAAGAVSANQIAANTITAAQIASGTITAAQLAAYSITAEKVQTGVLTLDKLTSSSNTFNGVTFGLGSGSSIAGYSAGGFFSSTLSTKAGLLVSNNANGMALGVGNVGTTQSAASFVNSIDTSYSSHYTAADICSKSIAGYFHNITSGKGIQLANMSYAFQTNGGAVGSFTGAHDGVILKTSVLPQLGDIMVDESLYAVKDMDDSMCINGVSTVARQKNVIGAYNGKTHSSHIPTSVSKLVTDGGGKPTAMVDTNKYTDFSNYYTIVVSALGEGLINVCGVNGNIEVGDLICSSSIKGKGMKQDDDLVHNYTVAKARESVIFDSPEQVKQIACIYMCG